MGNVGDLGEFQTNGNGRNGQTEPHEGTCRSDIEKGLSRCDSALHEDDCPEGPE